MGRGENFLFLVKRDFTVIGLCMPYNRKTRYGLRNQYSPLLYCRDAQAVPSDFQAEFHHRGTNSIKTSIGVGANNNVKYHEIDCFINDDYPIKCRREGHEVFLPFSFVQKYFEVKCW